MRLAIAGLVIGILPVAAYAEHRDYDRPDPCERSYRYESRGYDRGYGYSDRPVYREYRVERYDPAPVHVDDLGDGRHYRDHHVFYDSRGYERDYHHTHHYDD